MPLVQRNPILREATSEFLGKNLDTLPVTKSFPKKRPGSSLTRSFQSPVQQYQRASEVPAINFLWRPSHTQVCKRRQPLSAVN
jgi:hypothetical protein